MATVAEGRARPRLLAHSPLGSPSTYFAHCHSTPISVSRPPSSPRPRPPLDRRGEVNRPAHAEAWLHHELAYRDATRSGEIHISWLLNRPACRFEHQVDLDASTSFGSGVRRRGVRTGHILVDPTSDGASPSVTTLKGGPRLGEACGARVRGGSRVSIGQLKKGWSGSRQHRTSEHLRGFLLAPRAPTSARSRKEAQTKPLLPMQTLAGPRAGWLNAPPAIGLPPRVRPLRQH